MWNFSWNCVAVNADADESYQPEGNKTGNDTDSGDSDYRVGETDDFNATTDEDNREPGDNISWMLLCYLNNISEK